MGGFSAQNAFAIILIVFDVLQLRIALASIGRHTLEI